VQSPAAALVAQQGAVTLPQKIHPVAGGGASGFARCDTPERNVTKYHRLPTWLSAKWLHVIVAPAGTRATWSQLSRKHDLMGLSCVAVVVFPASADAGTTGPAAPGAGPAGTAWSAPTSATIVAVIERDISLHPLSVVVLHRG
jgi:hypothetical protein